ncbi:tRNA N(3)-methylcytidine methyltransferase METTL2A isoform X1 [Ochotona princeps]|uniref:tRNA N(3)-methylcytidine methyltransferase METTL2A isoform X1 n=1 Tax=Ochotona princeps TaxID=9978 RepID=UPI0027155BE7|nr:tRNA N(3)-methylcytidine methyltransferase METTL2A isoform X1 [Ochotona princeps]
MADCSCGEAAAAEGGKRQQFGSRFLKDPARVFHHNAWDNVEWSEEQAAAAERKVQENSAQRVCQEKQEDYELNAHKYWNDFYKIHENGFFKDRHWLFTEFPELAPDQNTCHPSEAPECADSEAAPALTAAVQHTGSVGSFGPGTELPPGVDEAAQQLSLLHIGAHEFPGCSATYRILEVGCGVGNTVFPILQTNNDPGLFVYCCDFASRAVELVQTHPEYDPSRCFAFVHDLCDEGQHYPVPEASLDVIVLIFVLSAIVPDKMQQAVGRLARLLRPGGMMLLRDYGRYDMAQLRFKKGQCLSGNFYVRGDGTRVYFFTQDELDALFTAAGLEKVQNLVDRRLQVNRGKQLMMYRVWIQCKYRKPLLSQPS